MRRPLFFFSFLFLCHCQSCVGICDHCDIAEAGDASAICDPNTPFGEPEPFATLNTVRQELAPILTEDERTVFYLSDRNNGPSQLGIWMATRSSIDEPFTFAKEIKARDGGDEMSGLALTPNALRLYVSAYLPDAGQNGSNLRDLFFLERPTAGDSFDPTLNSVFGHTAGYQEFELSLAPRSGDLYVASQIDIGMEYNLFVSHLIDGQRGPWGALNRVNDASASEHSPVISYDELTLYYAIREPGGLTYTADVYKANRSSPTGQWGSPQIVEELSVPGRGEYPSWLSRDNCRLYMSMTTPDADSTKSKDGWDLYLARRQPK